MKKCIKSLNCNKFFFMKRKNKYGKLRLKAEEFLRNNLPVFDNSDIKEFDKILNELNLAHIELELQNDDLNDKQNELEKAHNELNNSRNKYIDLFDKAPVSYIILDVDTVIIDLNETSIELFGDQKASFIGKSFHSFISNESQDEYYFFFQKVIQTDKNMEVELKMRTIEGITFDALVQCRRFIDLDDMTIQIRTIVQDISQHKKYEEKLLRINQDLQKSDMLLSEIIEKNSNGIIVIDHKHRLKFINPSAEKILGVKSANIKGKKFNYKINYNGISELICQKPDKSFVFCEANSVEFEWEGNPSYLITLRNISYRKELEENLKQAKHEATKSKLDEKEIVELKTRFLDLLSHEYRTPLTVIRSSSELLENYIKENNTEKINAHISKIQRSIDFMSQVIEDIINSDIDDENYKINTSKVDLADLANNIFSHIKHIDKNQHNFEFDINCKEKYVTSDYRLLRQVIINLLINSIKFSAQGSLIKFSLNQNNEYCSILLKDNGIKLSSNQIKMLKDKSNNFEMFGSSFILTHVDKVVKILGGNFSVDINSNNTVHFLAKIKKNL